MVPALTAARTARRRLAPTATVASANRRSAGSSTKPAKRPTFLFPQDHSFCCSLAINTVVHDIVPTSQTDPHAVRSGVAGAWRLGSKWFPAVPSSTFFKQASCAKSTGQADPHAARSRVCRCAEVLVFITAIIINNNICLWTRPVGVWLVPQAATHS